MPMYVGDMVRPDLSDELVEDIKKVVDQESDIDPDRVGVEHNLEILLSKVGSISVSKGRGEEPEAAKVREKYS
jgi:hypothetical protein